ncbi:MAG: type II toxin-antitoxin system RelE/ParE family toxin [Gammaproteobacteria bacterium]|nr:type II toxin-antitoxin system RelE/ParE family toxin [Gammaproteobacteria bacterium]
MIKNFRHKGLKLLYEKGDRRKIQADHAEKIRSILFMLEQMESMDDLAYLGLRLHPLKGDLANFWSVTVSANWRIIFRFDGEDASEIDLIDYH